MKNKYKSKEISFLDAYDNIKNLCAFDEYYYFESEEEIKEATQILDEEFEEIISKIVVAELTEPETPQPTQLDRIEAAVSNTLDEIRAEAVDEYTLSLMENNII